MSDLMENADANTFTTSNDSDYFKHDIALFKSIEEGEEVNILNYLKRTLNEADKWVVRRSTDDSVTWRRLPIHEACIRVLSRPVLNALIKAHPFGLQEPDTFGRLPLHHACIHGASEEAIMSLVLAHPEAIEATDMWGKTPLSIAELSANENKNKICALLSNDVPFFYQKKQEIVVEERMKIEKDKHRDELNSMEQTWKAKLLKSNQAAKDEYYKLEATSKEKYKSLKEEWTNAIDESGHSIYEIQVKTLTEDLGNRTKELEIVTEKHSKSKRTSDQTIAELKAKVADDEKLIVSLENMNAELKCLTNELEASNLQKTEKFNKSKGISDKTVAELRAKGAEDENKMALLNAKLSEIEASDLKNKETNSNMSRTIETLKDKATNDVIAIKSLEKNLKYALEELTTCKQELGAVTTAFEETRTKDEEIKNTLQLSFDNIMIKSERYCETFEAWKKEMLVKEANAQNRQMILEMNLKSQKEESTNTISRLSENLATCKQQLSALKSNFEDARSKDEKSKKILQNSITEITKRAYMSVKFLKDDIISKEAAARISEERKSESRQTIETLKEAMRAKDVFFQELEEKIRSERQSTSKTIIALSTKVGRIS